MKRIFTPAKKTTILIVDDDRVVVHIYGEKFRRQGFRVEVSNDGNDAIDKLRQVPVDLVVLDLCLPGTKGMDVLTTIRADFDPALPVIVFSNNYLGNLMREATAAGATICVTKAESTPARMCELILALLSGDQAAVAEVRTTFADITGTAPQGQVPPEGEKELITNLLLSMPQTLGKLRAGHQVLGMSEEKEERLAELERMHQQIHSLAGSDALIGFRKIAQMANAMEALLIELHAKPEKITPSVIRTIGQAIDSLGSLLDEATNAQADAFVEPKILVVDDEVISREMLCKALKKANLIAVTLDDPFAAQRLLEQERFDLIFLDVEMPGLTGIELCKSVRQRPTNRVTPVVFVTAHSDFANRAQSAVSGGNDFIAKPFLLVELAVKALTWLFRTKTPPLPAVTLSEAPLVLLAPSMIPALVH